MSIAVKIVGSVIGTVEFDQTEILRSDVVEASAYALSENAIGDVNLSRVSDRVKRLEIEILTHLRTTLTRAETVAAATEEITVYPCMLKDATENYVCILANPEGAIDILAGGYSKANEILSFIFLEQAA